MADSCRGVSHWHDRADSGFIASYLSGSIEKFGAGGGNFRRVFAGFLRWAREMNPGRSEERLPVLGDRAVSCWTELARTLDSAFLEEGAKDPWKRASEQVNGILEIETELFEALDRISGNRGRKTPGGPCPPPGGIEFAKGVRAKAGRPSSPRCRPCSRQSHLLFFSCVQGSSPPRR